MARSDRYRFGDILLPELAKNVASIPDILRQQQADEMDREKIALENKRIDAAKQQNDRVFQSEENARAQAAERYKEEFAFKKDQAKQLEMNRLVASVEEPYQKAMIYRKYGFNDLAENFTSIGDKQEAQKDVLREFDSFTDPNEILQNSSTALSGLDPTSSAATYVREARQQAIDDLDVKYSELLEISEFRIAHERYTQGMKDLTMSEDNKKLLSEAYVKSLEKYGAIDTTGLKGDGSSTEDFTESEVNQMVDEVLGGTGLNLSTGEVFDDDRPVEEQAQEAIDTSAMSVGQINKSLQSSKKALRELEQRKRFQKLSTGQERELQRQTAIVKELESRMAEERSRGKEAKKVVKETRREQARFGYSPFR